VIDVYLSSQQPWLMYFKVPNNRDWCILNPNTYQVPNKFYDVKYDVTIYEQFFYDVIIYDVRFSRIRCYRPPPICRLEYTKM